MTDASEPGGASVDVTDKHVLIGRKIRYELVTGNLADATEDTVVNSTGKDINLRISVSKAIAKKAGPELAAACSSLTPLRYGQVVSTEGFNMPCKQILHCHCHYWKLDSNAQKLKEIITRCLEMAAQSGHKSIALPAIGMGVKGYPADVIANTLVQAVTEYAEKNPQSPLTDVKLYLYKGDATDELLQKFLWSIKSCAYTKTANGFSFANGMKMEVFRGDLAEIKADIIVNSTGSHMSLAGGNVSLALLNKAGKVLQEECSKLAPIITGEIVRTEGFGLRCDYVLHVNCPIFQLGVTEKTMQELITKCLVWANDSGATNIAFPAMGTGVLGYSPSVIADCFIQACISFSRTHRSTSIAKTMMVVFDKDTNAISGFEKKFGLKLSQDPRRQPVDAEHPVAIPKVPTEYGKIVIDLPTFWEKPVNQYTDIAVSQDTTEWRDVDTSLRKTLNKPANSVVVVEIIRVQNPFGYYLYDTMKKGVARQLNKQDSEVETAPLWHGTAESKLEKITRTKFDRGLSGDVGANILGAACYFSTSAAYSSKPKYSPPNSAGIKVMILARVITGEYCMGNSTLKQAPYKPGSQIEQYDSVVNNLSDPTMYAVFHDASAYPEYIIKYKFL